MKTFPKHQQAPAPLTVAGQETLFMSIGQLQLRNSPLAPEAPEAIALYFSPQSSFPALHWRSIHDCLADLNRLAQDAKTRSEAKA